VDSWFDEIDGGEVAKDVEEVLAGVASAVDPGPTLGAWDCLLSKQEYFYFFIGGFFQSMKRN
jgi:hypothetical protein